MNTPQGTVLIVDDDSSMRSALTRLCQSAGLRVKAYSTAREFLEAGVTDSPSCLVLDVRMPGLSGLDLQSELAARSIRTPVVFITGHGDIPMSVRAMKAGAVDFLTKPFHNQDLLGVIQNALCKDVQLNTDLREREAVQHRLDTLTPRERQVFELVIKGLLNKQIAGELGASEQTIKVHRARIMEKMQVTSVAELVQAAVRVGTLKA
jgi:two-component system, LuxR family, response regulator FixJ